MGQDLPELREYSYGDRRPACMQKRASKGFRVHKYGYGEEDASHVCTAEFHPYDNTLSSYAIHAI